MEISTKCCGAWLTGALCLGLIGCSWQGDRVATADPPAAPQPQDSAEPLDDEAGTAQTNQTPASVETFLPADAELFPEEPAFSATAREIEAMSPEEREFHQHLRQLELEAVQNAPQFEEDAEIPAIVVEETPALFDELNAAEIPEDFDIAKNREERLKATKSELPLVLNKQVIRLINYFTHRRGRKTFKRTLERSGAYRKMIERILDEEGVPKEMLHLAQAESGFRPKARSWARATGMWQFVSFRGRQYGLRRNRYIDERYDPEKATRAAARHLKDLYIEFGDWYLAMAAYNGGPQRVRRGISISKSRDYWELSRRRFLRRETRNYVPIILAMTYVAKNDWLYESTEFDWAPELRYDTVTTDSEIHLDLIAEITGSTPGTIKQLNPALLRTATPPMTYDLRLPEGTADRFQKEITLIPPDKRLAWRRYEVKDGDTIEAIAKRFKVKEATIAELNSLEAGDLPEGLRLTIPGAKRRVKYYYSGAGGFREGGTGRYRIARGDTLGGISRRYGVSIAQLKQWNGLSSSRIIAGRYLIVDPSGKNPKAAGSSGGLRLGGSGRYKIRRGDTLGKIARRFGTSVNQLKAWNGLSSSRIQRGRYLIVQAPGSRKAETERASAGSRQPQEPVPATGQYRIRRGDTLSTIAGRFGVTVAELRQWNGMRSSRIRAGKYLVVRPEGSGKTRLEETTTAAARTRRPTPRTVRGPGEYRIRRGDTLAVIAERFGVTVANLKSWNGLRSSRITAGDYLTVRPPGASPAAAKAASRPAPANGSAPVRYKIRRGDNLAVIAQRFGVTVKDLKSWNGLRSSRITAGDYLTVRPPGASPAPAAAKAVSRPTPARRSRPATAAATRYKIRFGDTLAVIARRHGVTVADLQAWNGLRSSRIRAGSYLTIRGGNGSSGGGQYLVRRGDTLGKIASRFGVTVRQLQAWNGLRSTRIRAGHYLVVEPPGGGGGPAGDGG